MTEMAAIPPSLLHATLSELRRHIPFRQMDEAHLVWMIERLRLTFHPQNATLLAPDQGNVRGFYIVKQGSVAGEPPKLESDDAPPHWELTEGECFPLGALLSERPVANVYRATEDTFCYVLSASDFTTLLKKSEPFHDFCTRRLAHLLEQSHGLVQREFAHLAASGQAWNKSLGALMTHPPVGVGPGTSIVSALQTMARENIGSVVIVDPDQKPIGIFTLHDLLSRVALAGVDTGRPISEVMTPGPITLPPQATASDAALCMARHAIRHLLVTEQNRLIGVISERDLFALQRIGLAEVGVAIREARDVPALRAAKRNIEQLAHNMLAQGVAADPLTRIITTLNDTLTGRLVQLEFVASGIDASRVCWLAFGSEGRREQTLTTDQDNGLIFQDEMGTPADDIRQALLPVARRINEGLDACGFPLCKGNIMASNPALALSVSEWKARFDHWIAQGDPESLLRSAIFFDFRPLHGDASLASELRGWVTRRAQETPRFLRQMAENALINRPPLGVIKDFRFSGQNARSHTLDLKLNGTTPFVDGARIYALAAGIEDTHTAVRLYKAGERLGIPQSEIEAWCEAFAYIQLLRLRHQQLPQNSPGDENRIDPDTLSELDRRILKEAFRQARKLQSRLALDYEIAVF